ncbi:TetR/AcrR family transcriptional regulator [Lentzea guizhouensis]|nr:TetR/AcrR family transcriptional regulator [Lentzea guizhouensis]
MNGSRRQQIVDAARAILAENPESTLAVRVVAERAGIGASTLRHYFPTQQALHEAIFAAALDDAPPELRIHDTSLPAETRLRECLLQLLPPPQPLSRAAADRMLTVLSTTFGSGSTTEARNVWAAYTARTLDAIAGWLRVLADQGAIAETGLRQRARFLLTVVEGLALSRIVPVARPTGDEEDGVLDDALSVVFRVTPAQPDPDAQR